ncbi:MAG TPA: N-acetyl-gamma-glutamyl-phosphate reductase [Longimicrobiales bacterium]|nr:N-acetyl-gamma-glutamyl-phosphate reductase [Longimicrobiales bacterium]
MKTHKNSIVAVGVVGATGYTGRELATLLSRHPDVSVRFATSRSEAGSVGPGGIRLTDPDEAPLEEVKVVFLCLPHGEAAPWVERLAGGTARVVDLTADHRPGSGREAGAVYGLPELNASEVAAARLVANPGCYPTGVILGLAPLHTAGLLDAGRPVVIQAASGVTGAGRTPRTDLLFAEVHGDFRAYGLGNRHRHLREMRALLPGLQLLFTPHLLPVPRGILETVVVPVEESVNAETLRDAWRDAYPDGGAVRVDGEGAPALARVVGTDLLVLSAHDNEGLEAPVVTVVAALDNLGKGAAGQAVQNMNLLLGLEPRTGIRCEPR